MPLQAVQDEMENRLIGLREDFQASQQQLTQQFAQHQVFTCQDGTCDPSIIAAVAVAATNMCRIHVL